MMSPNQLMAAACDEMLAGCAPIDTMDWVALIRYFAVNIHRDVARVATPLVARILDCPLPIEEIAGIVDRQLEMEGRA